MTVEEVIRTIVTEKNHQRVYPPWAMLNEVRGLCNLPESDFRKELIKLLKGGKITFHRTINSHAIELIENE